MSGTGTTTVGAGKTFTIDSANTLARNFGNNGTLTSRGTLTLTGAVRVFDGTVMAGTSGADFGVRGFVTALDAETGKIKWKFYTTRLPAVDSTPPLPVSLCSTRQASFCVTGFQADNQDFCWREVTSFVGVASEGESVVCAAPLMVKPEGVCARENSGDSIINPKGI